MYKKNKYVIEENMLLIEDSDYEALLNLMGEFENLKGLIYFTDGYGVFPTQKPLISSIKDYLP